MGHLNSFFVPRGGNLNKPIFKSSNAPGEMLKLQFDWYINGQTVFDQTSDNGKPFKSKVERGG